MMRSSAALALLLVLISPAFLWPSSPCEAQNKLAPPEYDYYSLALTSISSSAAEASKLPDIPQRVGLLIDAATILPFSRRDEAVSLLEVALRDVKEWGSQNKASWYQRNTAAELRNEIMAGYAKLDPEKATALQKEFQASAESTTSESGGSSNKDKGWFAHFSERRAISDQSAKIALSIVDTDPEKASVLVLQSLQGGTVSNVLVGIVQKEIQNGNRAFLNKLEIDIGQVLTGNVTLDPFSLAYASSLAQSDKDMTPVARSAIIGFLMRSVQVWSGLINSHSESAGFVVDTDYINIVFTMLSLYARPVILQYSPEQLLTFDLALDQVAPFVPEKAKAQLQAFQPEKFSEPRDRLNDILKDPNPQRRDLRLVGLVFQLLRNESEDSPKRFDLAADAISGFTDPDTKTAFTDLLVITRVNALVNQKDFIEARRLISSISTDETRAWALLALAATATKSEKVLGFELLSNGLQALDKASPSPHKVELALIATGMLAKSDPQRAFEALSDVSRYANSSATKVDPPAKPPVAFGLDAAIGETHTKLGVFPENLSDLQIDSSVSTLGTNDWFRANQIADSIREPALRLRMKLEFARALIAEGPKPAKKETKKTSVTNN
jgi:hypothetical protein